ncbi:MAG: glycosyltransferase [Actinomyces graevenitzii]|uniref:Glycosyltransferase n=1 Tax=Actinomyces graevenitzii TaxID=55565 RepID=A0A9E7ALW6_9ACTO|nr:glycosyltransferase [Actinomyces graevenitzii]UQF79249.1 MAG: glycosyltransferase [Actinomyces graevenitzii]
MTRVLELSAQAAGGVRAHIRQVSQLLAKDGHQVLLAGPSNVISPAPDAVGGACLRTYQIDIGARPSGADLKALRQLKQLAATVEVIHAHGLRAGALAVLAAKRLPAAKRPRVVVTLHNLPVGSAPTRLVGKALHLVVVKGADYVLTVSPDLLEKAKQLGLKAGEIAVVPAPARGCMDHVAQPEISQDSAQSLDAGSGVDSGSGYGASSDTDYDAAPCLLTIARLAPQKGLDLLLEAATLIKQRGIDFTWLVAGDGPLKAQLNQQIDDAALPVKLLGRREDIGALLSQADVVVQTSYWEGQPLTLREAMQAGRAIVATDVGGSAYTLAGCGQLVEPQAGPLADAVVAVISDPKRRETLEAASRAAVAKIPGETQLREQLDRVLAL